MAAVAEALVAGANDAGGKDNITVVLVRVPDISAEEASAPDDNWQTVATPDFSANEIATVLPVPDSGPVSPADTPLIYEGETPTTDEPTPNRT
jgi:hypothetical protein